MSIETDVGLLHEHYTRRDYAGLCDTSISNAARKQFVDELVGIVVDPEKGEFKPGKLHPKQFVDLYHLSTCACFNTIFIDKWTEIGMIQHTGYAFKHGEEDLDAMVDRDIRYNRAFTEQRYTDAAHIALENYAVIRDPQSTIGKLQSLCNAAVDSTELYTVILDHDAHLMKKGLVTQGNQQTGFLLSPFQLSTIVSEVLAGIDQNDGVKITIQGKYEGEVKPSKDTPIELSEQEVKEIQKKAQRNSLTRRSMVLDKFIGLLPELGIPEQGQAQNKMHFYGELTEVYAGLAQLSDGEAESRFGAKCQETYRIFADLEEKLQKEARAEREKRLSAATGRTITAGSGIILATNMDVAAVAKGNSPLLDARGQPEQQQNNDVNLRDILSNIK